MLTRVAASHLRVGSFQYASATGDLDLLRRLADHAIARHYPGAAMTDHPYLALFESVAAVQAVLMARWMLIGFIHGVMNTDNMTISGETIDYGPCAFMEAYDPDTVFSSIDQWGRYAYDNQPVVAAWNLARFAEALLPLLADNVDEGVALAEKAFGVFRAQYDETWTSGMRAKLGLSTDVDAATVRSLTDEVLALLKESRVDYTSFFRGLSHAARGDAEPTRGLFINLAGIDDWIARLACLRSRCRPDGPQQPDLHPAEPPRRRGAHRSDGRRVGAARAATHRGDGALRRAAGSAPLRDPGAGRVRRLPDVLRNLSVGTGGALLAGRLQDRTGHQKCRLVAVGGHDRHAGGAAQHHQREAAVGRVRDDQQVDPCILAVDGHHMLGLVFPPRPIEVRRPLQWWPIDVDGGDLSQQWRQSRDEVG